MNILSQIESILFVASRPLSPKKIAALLEVTDTKVLEALETLKMKYNHADSGLHIADTGSEVQMMTNSENSQIVMELVASDVMGELTKAQLETLTVIAYRSPITRPEIEQIRGVNCAVILRNLLIRGLILEEEDKEKMLPVYVLSLDALAHLGIRSVTELPEYDTLHAHEYIVETLARNEVLP